MGHIYKHTSPSGKAYIGQSGDKPGVRWYFHKWEAQAGSKLAFHYAIRKYGPDAFISEILHDGIETQEELNRLEKQEIEAHGTFRNGYNMTTGGDRDYKLSEEALLKMSIRLKARWSDEGYKAARLAKVNTKEFRAMFSQISTERWKDDGYREKVVTSMRDTLSTPAARRKRSSEVKKVLEDPEKYEARVAQVNASRNAKYPRVMVEGQFFRFVKDTVVPLNVNQGTAQWRVLATTPRWRWWHTIPNHNDPECDAVEECFATATWATANPDHANVPDWSRAFRFDEHLGPSAPGQHGPAPAWAKRAALRRG